MTHIERTKSKIDTPESLFAKIEDWRKQDLKVVFTNGCFDILHKGHVDYLNRASDFGDRLVVGINSDASVSKLKGPSRPIQDEDSRCWLLASLACISAVVLFSEDTPIELIDSIKPDVLIKGGDYSLNEIVGSKEVIQNGGSVEIIPFLNGYSTSLIEAKIRRSDIH